MPSLSCVTGNTLSLGRWVEALRYFGAEAAGVGGVEMEELIEEVISAIDREQLLPPMAVLQMLGQCSELGKGLPFSVARDYLLQHLQAAYASNSPPLSACNPTDE